MKDFGQEKEKNVSEPKWRTSCRNCRRRKIKCSGSPCEACISNGLECLVDVRAVMGRPKQQRLKNAVRSSSSSNKARDGGGGDTKRLKDVLNKIYEEIFSEISLPTNAFNVTLKSYMNQKAPFLQYGEEEMKEQQPCPAVVYDALMPMLVQNVLETCKQKYSCLGQSTANDRANYLAIALARDETVQFAVPYTSADNQSIVAIDDAEFFQVAQVWSKMHPMSACLNLSLASQSSPLGRALRGIIASEGLVMKGARGNRSDELLKEAHRHFYDTQLSKVGYQQTLLYACQVSSLLSWNSISHVKAKKGVTFLALACQLMTELQTDTSCLLSSEEQLSLESLRAFLSLITVWTFAQLDQSSGNIITAGSTDAGTRQTDQSRFFTNVCQMSSLLLDNHPNLDKHGPSTEGEEDINFISLCDHLRQALTSTALLVDNSTQSSNDFLIAASREILLLSLAVPHTNSNALLYSGRMQDLLVRCDTIALPLLARLENKQSQLQTSSPLPLLNKVTFHRSAIDESELAWKSMLASLLFITISEAIQAMVPVALIYQETKAFLPRLEDLCQSMLDTSMAFVVETPQLKQARENVSFCKDTLQSSSVSITPNSDNALQWIEQALLQPMPETQLNIPILDTMDEVIENDVFDSLWGQLQWDFQSDSSSSSTSPFVTPSSDSTGHE